MADALVGSTGFVGSSLLRQRRFDACFHSADVDTIGGREFELLVCAGAPAAKWIANQNAAGDRENLLRLRANLERVRCRRFVLVSTVDVFAAPCEVDEDCDPGAGPAQAYGRHRRELELFVRERFAGALIVRLSGLVGPGLRKNALHDLCHGHETGKLDPEAVYQFYPMVNLWSDIARAAGSGLTLVHFCGAPLRLGEVAREVFGRELTAPRPAGAPVPAYDVRSRHAGRMGGNGAYLYGPRESLLAVRAYAQSEPRAA